MISCIKQGRFLQILWSNYEINSKYMSLRKVVIMNAGSTWVSQFINVALVITFLRIIPRSLGWDSYGVWALLSTGLKYPMILENAFSLSINRFVAFYHNDREQLNRFVSASFLILFSISVLTVISAIVLSFFVSDIFTAITEEFAHDAQITCILVGVTLALKITEAAFNGTLMGFQYHTRYNAVAALINVFRMSLTITLLYFWRSMIVVQLAFVISAFISLAAVIYVTKKSIPGFSIEILKIRLQTIKELFRYTSHAAARSGSLIFMYSTLALLIGKVGTAENVSVYDIASRISGFINSLLAGAHNVFLPAVTNFFANSEHRKINNVIRKATNISSVITCAIMIMLLMYAKPVLVLLLGKMFLPAMIPVLWVTMFAIVPRGFFGIWIPSLAGMGHLREMTVMAILSASLAIVSEIVLLKGYVTVPMAPAIAQMIALWTYMGIWLPVYGAYKCNMSLYEYLKGGLFNSLKASAVSIAILLILNKLVRTNGYYWILMFVISGLIVLACFTVISLRNESRWMINVIKSRLGYESKSFV